MCAALNPYVKDKLKEKYRCSKYNNNHKQKSKQKNKDTTKIRQ